MTIATASFMCPVVRLHFPTPRHIFLSLSLFPVSSSLHFLSLPSFVFPFTFASSSSFFYILNLSLLVTYYYQMRLSAADIFASWPFFGCCLTSLGGLWNKLGPSPSCT